MRCGRQSVAVLGTPDVFGNREMKIDARLLGFKYSIWLSIPGTDVWHRDDDTQQAPSP